MLFKCWRNFNKDTPKNVVVFGVDDSSSSHADNCKNNIWILGEVPTYRIDEKFDSPEKKFRIFFLKQAQNFVWVCILKLLIVICWLIVKKSLNLKLTIKVLTF